VEKIRFMGLQLYNSRSFQNRTNNLSNPAFNPPSPRLRRARPQMNANSGSDFNH
jgi:hypothetical protein